MSTQAAKLSPSRSPEQKYWHKAEIQPGKAKVPLRLAKTIQESGLFLCDKSKVSSLDLQHAEFGAKFPVAFEKKHLFWQRCCEEHVLFSTSPSQN